MRSRFSGSPRAAVPGGVAAAEEPEVGVGTVALSGGGCVQAALERLAGVVCDGAMWSSGRPGRQTELHRAALQEDRLSRQHTHTDTHAHTHTHTLYKRCRSRDRFSSSHHCSTFSTCSSCSFSAGVRDKALCAFWIK